MKTISITLLLCLLISASHSQERFNIGGGFGVVSVKKEIGYNLNVYTGYSLSELINVGIDGWYGKLKHDDLYSIKAYVETGDSKWGFKPGEYNKVYFSILSGIGYLRYNYETENKETISLFLGTNINFNFHVNLLFGIKTGYYFSKYENPLISSLFIAYRF